MRFNSFLKEIRVSAGYTQQEIASVLKIDRSTYAYYESGKTEPNVTNLRKIANLYDMTVDDLLNCRLCAAPVGLNASDNAEFNALQSLRRLSRDEQNLILMYRACSDKEKLMQLIHDFRDADDDAPDAE